MLRRKIFNLPTIITFIRIGAIPVVALVYYIPLSWTHHAAAIIFAMAALSDFIDGYLARSMGLVTRFGAFLDPVADKLIVAVALVIVVDQHNYYFVALSAIIIICREIIISALREWMAEIGKRVSVSVSKMGKIKTLFQMVALFILLWCKKDTSAWFVGVGLITLYIAAGLTIWSMYMYLKIAWLDLTLAKECE